uniref:DUF2805 domain-containing protein n=1 Tax=Flavobacterium sp. TaxID=239 RepID=UPI00404B3CFB
MKKKVTIELNNETILKVVKMALEEKKPFGAVKEKFDLSEKELTEVMRKNLDKEKFEIWKVKALASKPKPKPLKFNTIEEDDLDSKYYIKNKFE